jgi:uncharacterized protein YjbJ (UPF0337 family)
MITVNHLPLLCLFLLFTTHTAMTMGSPPKEKTTSEKVKDNVNKKIDTAKSETKKGVRDLKDETCEMVYGKMDCASQKAKHKLESKKDNIEDQAKDLKRQRN